MEIRKPRQQGDMNGRNGLLLGASQTISKKRARHHIKNQLQKGCLEPERKNRGGPTDRIPSDRRGLRAQKMAGKGGPPINRGENPNVRNKGRGKTKNKK